MAKTQEAERVGAARRDRIVKAALDLFAAQGYEATSLAAVARSAGISQPGLLHHFRGKEVLLAAVLAERDQQSFDAVELERPYTGPPIIRALEIIDATVVRNAAHRELTRLGHLGAAHSPSLAIDWARERARRFREQLAGVIQKSIELGAVRPDADPQLTASFLLAGFAGFEGQWLVDDSFDMVRSMHAFTQMMRRDLLIQPESAPSVSKETSAS